MPNPYTGPFEPQRWRSVIWAITSVFESGSPEGDPTCYQNYDAGIVSYGKHQTTLQSGILSLLLDDYFVHSQSPTSQALRQEYAESTRQRDPSLRNDTRFRDLLIQAASEKAMLEAQDRIFDKYFFQPAVEKAQQLNILSPLGLTVIYDNRIQGGLTTVQNAVIARLGGNIIGQSGLEEDDWIAVSLEEREAYLNRIADRAEADGRTADANALRISTYRVRSLRSLAEAGNYTLTGTFQVHGHTVKGLSPEVFAPKTSNSQLIRLGGEQINLTVRDTVFAALIRFVNTGTTTWSENFKIAYAGGADASPLAWETAFDLAEVASFLPVPPGKGTDLAVQMEVPKRAGRRYRTVWQLQDEQGKWFGERFTLDVAVSS